MATELELTPKTKRPVGEPCCEPVVYPDIERGEAEGLLAPYEPKGFSAINRKYSDSSNPPSWVGMDVFAAVVCYNTVEGKKKNIPPPASWADLAKPVYKGQITMPNLGEAFPRPYQRDELIHANADYGRIVCHCERVTRGEIVDATHSTIPARSPDALRRRTRAQMGRCQGFFCAAEINALLGRST